MTRAEVDSAIYEYVRDSGVDPDKYDYSEINELLDDIGEGEEE